MLDDPELLLCRSLRLTEKLGSPGIEALADLGLLKARREMAAAAHLGIEPRSALQTFHIHQVCRDADVARPYRDRAITELIHEPIDRFADGGTSANIVSAGIPDDAGERPTAQSRRRDDTHTPELPQPAKTAEAQEKYRQK